MKTQNIMTNFLALAMGLLIASAAVSGSALGSLYGNAMVGRRSLPTMPRRANGRSGTGPSGFLSVDETPYAADDDVISSKGTELVGADYGVGNAGGDPGVIASAGVAGTFTTCPAVFGGALVDDCKAVLSDIRATNTTISVTGGLCLNWVEGTCLGRVCAREQGTGTVLRREAAWVVAALQEFAIPICVAGGRSGVVSDCPDYEAPCGEYRLWLQAFP